MLKYNLYKKVLNNNVKNMCTWFVYVRREKSYQSVKIRPKM